MHDDMRAKFDGSLQHRRGEGVVASQQRADVTRDGSQARDVGHFQLRVGRGFRPDQGRACGCRFHCGQIGHVHHHRAYAPLRQEFLCQYTQAGVTVIGNDDARSTGQAVEQQRHRGHPRSRGKCGLPALQRGQHVFQPVLGGIALALVFKTGDAFARRAVLEGGGQVDGWRQRASRGIGFAACVYRQRFGSHLCLRKGSQPAATSRKASRAASSVCAISVSPCADDRKPASKADGAR